MILAMLLISIEKKPFSIIKISLAFMPPQSVGCYCIYIYIEREREIYPYVYIKGYICLLNYVLLQFVLCDGHNRTQK